MADQLDTAAGVAAFLGGQGFDPAVPLRQSVAGAMTANPDAEARLQAAAQKLGISPLAARTAPDEVQRQATLKAIDFTQLVQQYPATAKLLLEQDKARVAHDDIGPLQAIESAIGKAVRYVMGADGRGGMPNDLAAGVYNKARGAAGVFQAASEFAAAPFDVFEPDDPNAPARLSPRIVAPLPGGNPLRRLAEGFGMIGAEAGATAKRLSPPSADLIGGGVSSGVQSLAQNLLSMPLALANPALMLADMATSTAGQSYQDAREAKLPMSAALPFAVSQGVIEAGTEMLSLPAFMGLLKPGKFGTKALEYLLKEQGGEQIATVLQDLNEWAVLPANRDKTVKDFLAERPAAALQTAIATAVGGGGQVAVAKVIGDVLDAVGARVQSAEAAQVQADMLGRLVALAEASKLRERAPDTFEQFVQQASEDGPVSDVYIDAQTLQQSGLAEQLAQASPAVAAQLPEALATGGDVRIPVGEFAARVVGTDLAQPLLEHLRTEPGGMSRAEAEAYLQTHQDEVQQQVERALADHQGDTTWRAAVDEVKAQVRQQLDAAGRFTGQVNDAYAALVAQWYGVTAARLGLTPQELLQRRPLQVRGQPLAGEVLEQAEQPRDLILAHNLSADNLRFSLDLGGIPAPSLAITKADSPIQGFGEITLIGDTRLATPSASNPVFNTDVYSPRFPDVRVKVDEKAVSRAMQPLVDAAKAAGIYSTEVDRLVEEMRRNQLSNAVGDAVHSLGLRYAYATQVKGLQIDIPTRVEPGRAAGDGGGITASEPLASYLKTIDLGAVSENSPESAVLAEKVAVTSLNMQFARAEKAKAEGKTASDPLKVAAVLANRVAKIWGTGGIARTIELAEGVEPLQIPARLHDQGLYQLYRLQENTPTPATPDQKVVDITALGKVLDDAVDTEEMRAWVREQLQPAMGEKRIVKDGGRTVPHTLDNIVREMTRKVRDAEGFNYGLGNARSNGAKRFKSLKDVQAHRGQVQAKAAVEAAIKANTERFNALTERVSKYLPDEGQRYVRQTWERLPDVIGESYRLGMARALRENGFQEVPADLVADLVAFAADLTELPAEYFEAKPQRAVQVSEFRGAVIPSDAAADVREALAMAGLQVLEYERGAQDSRDQATRQLAEQLNAERGDVLFQQARGTFAPSTNTITLLQGADLSTFLHESGHFFLESMLDFAAQLEGQQREGAGLSPGELELLADANALLRWFGMESLTEWGRLSLDERRDAHEKFARGFEAYLYEGKSPAIELHGLFQRFRAWLLSVYKSLKELNVEISDEVRGVMDRMLASTEEIKLAEQGRSMLPLFDSAAQAGMTTEEFRAYQALGVDATNDAIAELQARGLRDMQWMRNARGRVLKRLRREAADRRREVRAEVRTEVMSQPIYRAWTFLTAKIEAEDMLPGDAERAAQRDALRAWRAERAAAETAALKEEEQAVWEASPESQVRRRTQRTADAAHRRVLRAAREGIDQAVAERMQAWDQEHPQPKGPAAPTSGGDSLLVAIAKLGGISRDSAQRDLGVHPDNFGFRVPVFGRSQVFRASGGLTADDMLQALTEAGYRHRLDEHGRSDLRELEDLIGAELGGDPQYSIFHDHGAAQAEEARRQVANPEALQAGRLDLLDLRRIGLPDEVLQRLQALKMTAKEGLPPDLVAGLFGFSSGDELARALAAATPPSEEVESLTDRRMLERYGELATPQDIERAADAALANDARGRMIATEAAALARAIGPREATGRRNAQGRDITQAVVPRAAREWAARMIGRLKVRDIRPGQYSAAETRAARNAARASAAGDLAAAAAEKRNQLVQHYAAKSAHEALDEIERGVRYLRGFERDGTRKALDAGYLDQIDALLDRFDLRKVSNKALDRRVSLMAWVEAQREQGMEPDIPDALLDEANRRSYRDMSVEEFRGLVDSVRQIEHLARLKHRLLTARDQRAFEAVRDEIANSIEANAGDRKADTRTPTTNLGRMAQGFRRFWAAHIKVASWSRIMDGGENGPVWEHIIRTANERGDREATMRAEATAALSAILAPVFAQGKMGGTGQFFPTIKRSLNRGARLTIALNAGNEGNLQRLLGGEGWTLEQVLPVLQSLTAAEWQAVQAIWDHFESYRPAIGAKEKRVYGKEPTWVEPSPFDVRTADGQTVSLRGGYYPIKFDPAASQRAEEHADAEAAKRQLQGAYTSATTRRSFTKTRAGEVQGRPLLYTLAGLYGGVNDVIHDLQWHEWLIDVNRLLRSHAIDSAMRERYGPEVKAEFKNWVQDIAEGGRAAQHAGEMLAAAMRQGISAAGLGFNVMSAAMQPLGLTQSVVRVGTKWVGRGIARYLANPRALARAVNARSDFMQNRARTRFRELNELRNRVQDQSTAREWVGRYAYWLMMKAQGMVDLPTWWGAYERALAEGESEDRAAALADQMVIDAQGGGQEKDQAGIERGGAVWKFFTVFYSFMNTALNLAYVQGATAPPTARGRAKLAADMLLLLTVPAVLGQVLKDALTPGGGDDDDWEALARKLAAAQIEYLMGLMVVVREFAEAGKIVSGAEGVRGYSGPAGARLIGDSLKAVQQISQGEFDDALRKALVNVAGDLTGLPAAQTNRTITGIEALADGETQNPAALLFGYQKQ